MSRGGPRGLQTGDVLLAHAEQLEGVDLGQEYVLDDLKSWPLLEM